MPTHPATLNLLGVLIGLDTKRCYDVKVSRQEGSTMRHLANAHSMTGLAGNIYRTPFSGVWQDWLRQPVKQLSVG